MFLDGAPCPFVIHSCKDPTDRKLTAQMMQGFYEKDGSSPSGIKVVCDKSGSMTTRSFNEWCHHFVEQLPESQGGPDGQVVFLFLDGHGSRWSYEGLLFLRENNVVAFCLPSHTSIWSQVIVIFI
jgi:hypothetical protein